MSDEPETEAVETVTFRMTIELATVNGGYVEVPVPLPAMPADDQINQIWVHITGRQASTLGWSVLPIRTEQAVPSSAVDPEVTG